VLSDEKFNGTQCLPEASAGVLSDGALVVASAASLSAAALELSADILDVNGVRL